jgi:hypothetical protein
VISCFHPEGRLARLIREFDKTADLCYDFPRVSLLADPDKQPLRAGFSRVIHPALASLDEGG